VRSSRSCQKDFMDVTIAIISYNTEALLLACLHSIRRTCGDVTYEVVVVDNASVDGSVEAVRRTYPDVIVIQNPVNGGYAKACNRAAEASRARHVLFLNSDTIMKDGTVRSMMTALDLEPGLGAVSCLQRNKDEALLRSCFPFPSIREHLCHTVWLPPCVRRVFGSPCELDFLRSQDVDWANGACLMVRTDVFKGIGAFDEGFFMYFEDTDLCRRLRNAGYRIRHLAEGEIIHVIGGSSSTMRSKLNVQWELSRIRYVDKHFPPFTRRMMKAWIAVGASLRLIGALGPNPSTAKESRFGAYATVVRRLWHRERPMSSQLTWTEQSRG
jgi:GT2 family glycosyltransferase